MLNKTRHSLLQQREFTIIGRTSLLKEGRREDSRCCNVKTSWHQYFDNGCTQGMHKSIWQPKDEAAADSVLLVRGWHQASSIKDNRCNLETNTIKCNLNFLLGCTSQREFNLKQCLVYLSDEASYLSVKQIQANSVFHYITIICHVPVAEETKKIRQCQIKQN